MSTPLLRSTRTQQVYIVPVQQPYNYSYSYTTPEQAVANLINFFFIGVGLFFVAFLIAYLVEIRKQKQRKVSYRRYYSPSPSQSKLASHRYWNASSPYSPPQTQASQPPAPPVTPRTQPSLWGPTGVVLGRSTQSTPASEAIKQKLHSLAGDWELSQRLVKQVMDKNPSQTEQWAYEKAIWDLERDRTRVPHHSSPSVTASARLNWLISECSSR